MNAGLLVGAMLAAELAGAQAQATRLQSIVIENVIVVPMDRERTLTSQTVIIEGTRIARLGRAGSVTIPAGARVIDGRGKYLVPGLVDNHVHLASNPESEQQALLKLFLVNGVTTVLNMRGTPQILALREAVAAGRVLGPRIYSVGPYVNEPFVTTPDEVERAVEDQKRAGYDFVKLHGNLSREAYARLNAVGRREGIRIIGHAPRNIGVDAMFEERQYAVAHAEEFLYNRNNSSPDSSLARVDASLPEWARAMARTGIWLMPNLTAFKSIGLQTRDLDAVLRRPEMRYLPRTVRQGWGPATNPYTNRNPPLQSAAIMTRYRLLERLVREFHRQGVRLLVGTDAMNAGVVPGFSVHDELSDLVAAGLTPYEALEAATSNAAAFFADGRRGTVTAGEAADLVLLEANPLADIANTRRIAGVIAGGRWFSDGDIAAILRDLDTGP